MLNPTLTYYFDSSCLNKKLIKNIKNSNYHKHKSTDYHFYDYLFDFKKLKLLTKQNKDFIRYETVNEIPKDWLILFNKDNVVRKFNITKNKFKKKSFELTYVSTMLNTLTYLNDLKDSGNLSVEENRIVEEKINFFMSLPITTIIVLEFNDRAKTLDTDKFLNFIE